MIEKFVNLQQHVFFLNRTETTPEFHGQMNACLSSVSEDICCSMSSFRLVLCMLQIFCGVLTILSSLEEIHLYK